MTPVQLLIGGNLQNAANGATFERRNPLDDSVATVAAAASAADCTAAADAAAQAFPAWSATGPATRREHLMRAAQELKARAPALCAAMARETGASALWAGFNIQLAAGMLLEAGALTTQISGEVIPSNVPGSLAMAMRVPAGVVLGIAPWNAPLALGVRALAVPLACGNTVVFKGSEQCPETHALIVEALNAAGLPPGVLNFITNAPEQAAEVVETLIAHPRVRRVNFTGSTHVGRRIALLCAQHLKPAVLELGGKSPLLVLDDADIDAAVAAARFGAFANSGQICMSSERIIVDERIADEFVNKLATTSAALAVADPRETGGRPSPLGAVIGRGTVDRCNALIDDALAKGATLACGGKGTTLMMGATVLDHVRPDMQVYTDESFGPVKPVIRVSGDEAAIACANDNAYGLSAAVFSRDLARAWRVAQRIESGMCHINGPTVQDEPQMPFGGLKGSGYGRFGGKAGIDAFTELRWMTVQTEPRHYPF
ncbi:aldehyde dehydrogenase [Hydrogenophaga sp.]|uniref:aldehyde dehydrogenase n=1 Tax=Hydrogenophaga sp. TaxID=1904254 RepID=UPI00271DC0E2|nr:aldehyde dehydrogenase [Hydrogenophaga sp.]MDO9603214.1 aldehyde dehydrogenase [Hydrogenophaga sp.]